MTPRNLLIGLMGIVTAAVSPAFAVEGGCRPLWEPSTITEGGCYIVTQDIVATSGAALTVDPVAGSDRTFEIRLNGHTLSTTDVSAPVVDLLGESASDIMIIFLNGGLRGGLHGLRAGAVSLRLQDIDVRGSAGDGLKLIDSGEQIQFLRVAVSDVGGRGLDFVGGDVLFLGVDDLTVSHTGDTGVHIEATGTGPASIRLRGVEIYQIPTGARILAGGNITIVGNRIRNTTVGPGIQIHRPLENGQQGGEVVAGNTVADTAGPGIEIRGGAGAGGRIVDNVVRNAGGDGLSFFDITYYVVAGNSVSGSGGSGMVVRGDRSLVADNLLVSNGEWGLRLAAAATGNVVRGNVARGNAGGIAGCQSAPPATDYCDEGGGNDSAGDNFMPNLR